MIRGLRCVRSSYVQYTICCICLGHWYINIVYPRTYTDICIYICIMYTGARSFRTRRGHPRLLVAQKERSSSRPERLEHGCWVFLFFLIPGHSVACTVFTVQVQACFGVSLWTPRLEIMRNTLGKHMKGYTPDSVEPWREIKGETAEITPARIDFNLRNVWKGNFRFVFIQAILFLATN